MSPQLRAAQASAARLEQRPAERAVISRQEAHIRDLESRLDCQAVQMKRFEVRPGAGSRGRGSAQEVGTVTPAPGRGEGTAVLIAGVLARPAPRSVLAEGPQVSCCCQYSYLLWCLLKSNTGPVL